EHLVGALHGVLPVHAAQLTGIRDRFDADDAGEQALVLRREANGLPDVEPVRADVHVKHFAATGVHGYETKQRADERSLARPVRAEEADGARGNLHGELPQGGDLAVGLGDVVQREEHVRSGGKLPGGVAWYFAADPRIFSNLRLFYE